MGLGLLGVLWLGMAARSAEDERGARAEPVLEIMSLDQGDCTLGLSWPWSAMAVNHILFEDHGSPFKAVVDSTGQGVRVRIEGWEKEPFAVVADKGVWIIYSAAGRKEVDFTAEATAAGEVRI
jgi:hypothetical protein